MAAYPPPAGAHHPVSPQAEAQDEALEGGGPGVARLQLPAVCLDVPGGSAAGPPPGTRARPAATPATHPGRAHRPPGTVPSAAAGRPRRRGASRTFPLGRARPRPAPSSGPPTSACAGAVGRAAVRAARAGGARERAGPGLHVGRDGAVPLLRRRLRGGRADLRPGPAAPAPAEARAQRAGARAPVLPPDGLRGGGLLPGRAQPLPHAAGAVGAGVRVRVTLPHAPTLCACAGALPTLED